MDRLARALLGVVLAGCASARPPLAPESGAAAGEPPPTASSTTATPTPTATRGASAPTTATAISRPRGPNAPARIRSSARPDPLASLRALVRESAARRVGGQFRGDCSGFVVRAYRDAGIAVRVPGGRSGSEALFRASTPVDRPRPGDLAFFHDTYDRNRDRRLGDRFTHVALVESVQGSSVVLVHRGSRGIRRLKMDLSRPADGEANDRLRVERAADSPGTRYLSGQLFAAYGQLLGGRFTQMLPQGRSGDTSGRQALRR